MIGELFKAAAEELFGESKKEAGLAYTFAKANAGLHMLAGAAAAMVAGPPAPAMAGPSMAFDF